MSIVNIIMLFINFIYYINLKKNTLLTGRFLSLVYSFPGVLVPGRARPFSQDGICQFAALLWGPICDDIFHHHLIRDPAFALVGGWWCIPGGLAFAANVMMSHLITCRHLVRSSS